MKYIMYVYVCIPLPPPPAERSVLFRKRNASIGWGSRIWAKYVIFYLTYSGRERIQGRFMLGLLKMFLENRRWSITTEIIEYPCFLISILATESRCLSTFQGWCCSKILNSILRTAFCKAASFMDAYRSPMGFFTFHLLELYE